MPNRALLIKEPWASKVVSGEKTIEIRTMQTKKIGQEIYIAQAGTKTLIGKATIVKCVQLTMKDYIQLQHQACLTRSGLQQLFSTKRIYGWYLKDAMKFDKPIPYDHPRGAQVWIKIPKAAELE